MQTLDKTIINIKIDKTLKQEAQALAEEIGVPLSTIVITNLKDFVRSRSITLSAFPRLKPEIEREIETAVADFKKGRNISPVFSSPREAADYLRKL